MNIRNVALKKLAFLFMVLFIVLVNYNNPEMY